ncbi:MAG TPA: hypothetical protein VL978_04055 [Puia sp.]|nr:hypothetical protein [Puia sp.]
MRQKNLFKTILLTGLLVGTLDISYAYINVTVSSGKFPAAMFNYISGGALGLQSGLHGGTPAAFLGLFFHYFIAMAYTVLFFLLFPRLKFLWYDKFLVGMLYAVFVNVTVNQLIIPLTRVPSFGPFNLNRAFPDWLIFGVIFGVPIAVSAYRYYGVDAAVAAGGGH